MTKPLNLKFSLIIATVAFLASCMLSVGGVDGFLVAYAQTVESKDDRLPTHSVASDEVRFAAVGDTGSGGSQQYAVAQQMEATQKLTGFDLTLFLGDNIYPSGDPSGIEKKFLKPYRSLIQNGVEMRGCIGNHDAESDSGVLLQQMIFRMGTKTYYSFERNKKLVEFFCLDSNLLLRPAGDRQREEQLNWFDSSLARSEASWKVIFLHHPLYSSAKKHGWNSSDENEMQQVRESIEPMLRKHRVDFVLSGHDHVYERPIPQFGIHYFTSGSGGKLRQGDLIKTSPFYAFGNDRENSFMLFSITPQATKFWAVGKTGAILDSGEIKK